MKDQHHAWFTEALSSLQIDLPEGGSQQMFTFLDELQRWNRRINLTAITDRREAIEKHLLDSLTVLPLLQGTEQLLDLGSGAGLPGIPLKIACPQLKLWSVDAVQKKVAFQRQVGRLLGLRDFYPTHTRVEALAHDDLWLRRFDVVVARAVASLPTLVGWAMPLLRSAGHLVAMKGPEGGQELAAAQDDLLALGVRCVEERRLRLPGSGAERLLLIFEQS
jgi:16S rRNA (guanine527-N7)-methyltransferase